MMSRSNVTLRPYQVEAISKVGEAWRSGQNALIVLPTGTGKTVVFCELVRRVVEDGGRVLIMAHTKELLQQAGEKFASVSDIPYAQLPRKEKTWPEPVIISTPRSIANRLDDLSEDYFSLIVIDECHHIRGKTYETVVEYFKNARLLGVTATPMRGDDKELTKFFPTIHYELTLIEAIENGYLAPIVLHQIPIRFDLSEVKSSMGDYQAGGLGKAIRPYYEQIAAELEKLCAGRKICVFLPLIEMSKTFAEVLNHHGFHAVEVNGNSPDRAEILQDFEAGKYDAITNASLLTEGWDCPSVDCIVILRPTKLEGLYKQMVGRGLRTCEGKRDCLLVDFIWSEKTRVNLFSPCRLTTRDPRLIAKFAKKSENGEDTDLTDMTRDVEAEREAGLTEAFEWNDADRREYVDILAEEKKRREEKAEACAKLDLFGLGLAEITDARPATQAQKNALEKWMHLDRKKKYDKGLFDAIDMLNMAQASRLIGELVWRGQSGKGTFKHIRTLTQNGYDCVDWSFDQCGKAMGELMAKLKQKGNGNGKHGSYNRTANARLH